MKKYIHILIFAAVVPLASCSDFLEQSSQDLIRPTKVVHYVELLQGEAYFKDFYKTGCFMDVMTDDVQCDYAGSSTLIGRGPFLNGSFEWWADLEVISEDNTFTDNYFQMCYKNIYIANSCIYGLDNTDLEGSDIERASLRGQALFTRAFAYFLLANAYSKPYDPDTPNELCVPLKLDVDATSLTQYPRATMNEVWEQMWTDITDAMSLMKQDPEPKSIYEIDYPVVLLLATRIALFMEKYDEVIEYGSTYLNKYGALRDISEITDSPTSSGSFDDGGFLNPLSPGTESKLIFSALTSSSGIGSQRFVFGGAFYSPFFVASDELMELYENGDRRQNMWFEEEMSWLSFTFGYSPQKMVYYDGTGIATRTYFSQAFRTGEVYLNVAEAYMRRSSPDPAKALGLLNDIRINRIAEEDYIAKTTSDFAGNDDILNFVLEERRRELCFEQLFRWWDLRRLGMPSITHTYEENEEVSAAVFILKENDPRYVLNFPRAELEINSVLIPNERF